MERQQQKYISEKLFWGRATASFEVVTVNNQNENYRLRILEWKWKNWSQKQDFNDTRTAPVGTRAYLREWIAKLLSEDFPQVQFNSEDLQKLSQAKNTKIGNIKWLNSWAFTNGIDTYYRKATNTDPDSQKAKELHESAVRMSTFVARWKWEKFFNMVHERQIIGTRFHYTLRDGYKWEIDITPVTDYSEFIKNNEKILASKENEEMKKAESIFGGYAMMLFGTVWVWSGAITISKMWYKDASWKMKPLLLDKIFTGTKEELRASAIKILETSGVVFDPIKGCFERVTQYTKHVAGIRRWAELTYSEYKSTETERIKSGWSNETIMTEKEFEKSKADFKLLLKDKELQYLDYLEKQKGRLRSERPNIGEAEMEKLIESEIAAGKIVSKDAFVIRRLSSVLSTFPKWIHLGFNIIFLPDFLKDIHRNGRDVASIGRAAWEVGTFYGAEAVSPAIANWVARMISWWVPHPLLKIATFVAVFATMQCGGAVIAEKIHLDKKIWRTLPDREDFSEKKFGMSDKKSGTLHVLSLGVANDTSDVLHLPYFGTLDWFATNPREYMESGWGRTDEKWNARVDQYKSKTIKKTIKSISEYRSSWEGRIAEITNYRVTKEKYNSKLALYQKHIAEWEKEGRKKEKYAKIIAEYRELELMQKWLKEKTPRQNANIRNKTEAKEHIAKDLNDLFWENAYAGFNAYKQQALTFALAHIDDLSIPPEKIWEIVGCYIDGMKMTKESLQYVSGEVPNMSVELLQNLPKPDQEAYKKFRWLQQPLANLNDSIENFAKWEHKKYLTDLLNRFLKHETIIPKQWSERSLYFKLIDDQKLGNEFVNILNEMVEYKRTNDFMKNISRYGSAVDWSW